MTGPSGQVREAGRDERRERSVVKMLPHLKKNTLVCRVLDPDPDPVNIRPDPKH